MSAGSTNATAKRWWDRAQEGDPSIAAPTRNSERIGERRSTATATRITVRLQRSGDHYQAIIDNGLHGPVDTLLRWPPGEQHRTLPPLPLRRLVPGRTAFVAARLLRQDDAAPRHANLILDVVPGNPQAIPRDYLYLLPFEHSPIRIDQGFGGAYSHRTAENYYAIDFSLPEGTPIKAARDGVVMEVEAQYRASGREDPRGIAQANLVRILHDDGTMALYAHLRESGVQVRPGARVVAGQVIALSGNTGFSTAPHLHFVVQVNRDMRLTAIPFRMTTPQGELKIPRDDRAPH